MTAIYSPSAYEDAIKRNILLNARKTFVKTFPRGEEVLVFLDEKLALEGSFIHSLKTALARYGKLTEKQYEAVVNIIDGAAERKAQWAQKRADEAANSKHFGAVGDKVKDLSLNVVAVIEYAKHKFHYHDSSVGYIYIARTNDGNTVVIRPSKALLAFHQFRTEDGQLIGDENTSSSYLPVGRGDQIVVSGKIKEHGERNGEKQTVLSHVKINKFVK